MTLQNAPPGLDYERDKRFSKVRSLDAGSYLVGWSIAFVQSD